jgi:hypothetical protein
MELVVKMTGDLATLMCSLNPTWKCDEKGVLYLKCVKALNGHIEAARLFYNDLNHTLIEVMKFAWNRYDPCVYNKMTSDEQVTVRVHVDNLKISATTMRMIDSVINALQEVYGEIVVNKDDEQDYLGMIMRVDTKTKSLTLKMNNYVENSIMKFKEENPEVRIKEVKTPASESLFKTRQDVGKLSVKQNNSFHSTVAKLLFLAKRGRPDILLSVSFLTTRVQNPDEDDWKKLLRILSYLQDTMHFYLTISCKDLHKMSWFIDGSYAVHAEMKGHSGAV